MYCFGTTNKQKNTDSPSSWLAARRRIYDADFWPAPSTGHFFNGSTAFRRSRWNNLNCPAKIVISPASRVIARAENCEEGTLIMRTWYNGPENGHVALRAFAIIFKSDAFCYARQPHELFVRKKKYYCPGTKSGRLEFNRYLSFFEWPKLLVILLNHLLMQLENGLEVSQVLIFSSDKWRIRLNFLPRSRHRIRCV